MARWLIHRISRTSRAGSTWRTVMTLRSAFMAADQGVPRSPSLYRTVAEDIKAAIAAGRYAAGTRLPSEHELAERYSVSGVHSYHPRDPSGVRGGLVRGRARPHEAGQVGARRRLGGVVHRLEYKAARHGRTFARTGRFEPTSQVCSACGTTDGPKPLGVRTWTCAACGTVHDRDLNAARNILALGTPTTICGPGPRRCSARPSRECRNGGPGSTVRWTLAWPLMRFTTGPRSSPALSWSPGQAGVA